MVGLPRVPDGRAGLCSKAGLLGGSGASINKCQQCRKQHSWGAHSLLGGLGAVWGGEKIYLGSRQLIRIITSICAPQRGRGGMDRVGAFWMTFY